MQSCVMHLFSLALQTNEKIKDILAKTRSNPRRRLQYIYDIAKTKSMCEGGDLVDKKFDTTTADEMDTEKVLNVLCMYSCTW